MSAPPLTVSVHGLPELKAALAALPGSIRKRVVAAASREGINVILDEARRRVPNKGGPGRGHATGALYKALMVKVRPSGAEGVYIISLTARPPLHRLLHLVEYGTGMRFTKGGANVLANFRRPGAAKPPHSTGASAAEPFLRPSIVAAKDRAVAAFVEKGAETFPAAVAAVAARGIGRAIGRRVRGS